MGKRKPSPGHSWRFLAWPKRGQTKIAFDSKTTPGQFDELCVDDWLHVEQMDNRVWWMRVGEAVIWIEIGRDGKAHVRHTEGSFEP